MHELGANCDLSRMQKEINDLNELVDELRGLMDGILELECGHGDTGADRCRVMIEHNAACPSFGGA